MRSVVMKAKVCLVGEAAVGKTSLIRRYVLDQYDDRYETTLGAKVTKKELRIPIKEKHLEVQLRRVHARPASRPAGHPGRR